MTLEEIMQLIAPFMDLRVQRPQSGAMLAIDGPTGAGKSTKIAYVKKELEELGLEVAEDIKDKELGAKVFGFLSTKGQVYQDIDPFAAAEIIRGYSNKVYDEMVVPALTDGKIVLYDRSQFLTTEVFQPLLEAYSSGERDIGKIMARSKYYHDLYSSTIFPPDITAVLIGPIESFLSRGQIRDYKKHGKIYNKDEKDILRAAHGLYIALALLHENCRLVQVPYEDKISLDQVSLMMEHGLGQIDSKKSLIDSLVGKMDEADMAASQKMLYLFLDEIHRRAESGKYISGYDRQKVVSRMESLHKEIAIRHGLISRQLCNAAIDETLSSSDTKDYQAGLEMALKLYFGAGLPILTNSGANAFKIILSALDIKQGDEILVPANSIFLDIPPILQLGAKPVAYDTDKSGLHYDYHDLESKITAKTKAILIEDLFGILPDLRKISELKEKYPGIIFIEDACQAIGSVSASGVPAGRYGDLSFVSFDETKLVSMDKGGAILVNNPYILGGYEEAEKKIRALTTYGEDFTGKESVVLIGGMNSFVPKVSCARGKADLWLLDYKLMRLKNIRDQIAEKISAQQVFSPVDMPGQQANNYSFVLRYNLSTVPEGLHSALAEAGIHTNISRFDDRPIGMYAFSAHFSGQTVHVEGSTPNYAANYKRIVNIPLDWRMEKEHIERISSIINETAAKL